MAKGNHSLSAQPALAGFSDPTQSPEATDAGYVIRLKDHLATCWDAWFEGWTIVNLPNGEFLLRGSNVDLSALHGTLNKIRDLNLTLLSVIRNAPEEQAQPSARSTADDPKSNVP